VKAQIRIKKNNYHARKGDKLIVDYPCFISLEGCHTHNIQSIDSVARLKAGNQAKNVLRELFE